MLAQKSILVDTNSLMIFKIDFSFPNALEDFIYKPENTKYGET